MPMFSSNRAESVASLGEGQLIQAITRWLGKATRPAPFGIGDDCSQLPASKHPQLITVDPVIYGKHFDDSVSPRDVGAKLLKRNLSDIAAMGGQPGSAVIALALDPRTSLVWLEAFYRGLAACARQYDVAIVGGDVSQAEGVFCASLTLLGTAPNKRVLTRQGAQIGDALYVTGKLGGSLSSGRHFRFTPRLKEGAWLARQSEVVSMLDISDGLAKDKRSLTPAGMHLFIDKTALPLNKGCGVLEAMTDGEDYELLFVVSAQTKPATFLRKWKTQFPRTRLTRIGEFEAAGSERSLELECYFGYEHLR